MTAVTWLALGAASLLIVVETVRFDFRTKPLVADQASYLLQALSLAHDGHDLSFDSTDLDRWRAADWTDNPGSLFFQRTEDGWAFAKPYGYSLYLSPFVAGFGAVRGVALGNSLLFVLLLVVSAGILRVWFHGPAAPLLLGAFYVAAYPYFYVYVIHPDLFLAFLTAVALFLVMRYWQRGRVGYAVGGTAAMSFAIVEKVALLALFFPIAVLLLLELRTLARRAAAVAAAVATFAFGALPYLYYSDFKTWNPYAGERYFSSGVPPFGGGSVSGRVRSDVVFSVSYVEEQVTSGIPEKVESLAYYFVGRHTGMLVFLPVALLLLAAAVLRIRTLSRRAIAVLLGLCGYIAFYVVLFTGNYYGGGSSLGNRYFLQVAPVVLALAVAARLDSRVVFGLAVAGIALGAAFLLPHHRDPDDAFRSLDRVSRLQGLLPFESNQTEAEYFRSPPVGFLPNRIAPARAVPFRLVEKADGTVLRSPQETIPVREGWVAGTVDSIVHRQASVSITGWAARVETGAPLDGLMVKYAGEMWDGALIFSRPDVAAHFGDRRLIESGFRIDLPNVPGGRLEAVYAVVDGVASTVPWRS